MNIPGIDLHRAYPDLITLAEAELLASLKTDRIFLRSRQKAGQPGVRVTQASYLLDGFVGRFRADTQGRRQFLALQIPGDFIDLPAFMLGHVDHDIETLSPATITALPHARIAGLREAAPDIYDKLWHIALLDASIQRYWTFRTGRLVGRARVANLFAEMLVRQYARGLSGLDSCRLPISQTDLAQACGMTPVHANRLLGELREARICLFLDGRIEVLDLPALFRQGEFQWDYLYLPAGIDQHLTAIADGQCVAPRSARALLMPD